MQHRDAIEIVQAWQEAANHGDRDRLLDLSDQNIEIIGPRGSGYGHQLLIDWLDRAGLTLETQRIWTQDDQVVVAQHGVWRSVQTGEVMGEADLASRFRVVDGRVVQFARYDRVDEALAAAGLTEGDAISR